MKVMVRNEHTVLVMNGKPYGLFREKYPTHNNVCALCELSHVCMSGNEGLKLIDLCMGEDHPGAWYFIEDWQHLNKRIFDFVDVTDENYLNKHYPII